MPSQQSVNDAMLLLQNAAQQGLDVKPEIIKPVMEFEAALAAGAPAPDVAARFWQAYGLIAQLVRPVTVASLAAATRGTRKWGVWRLQWTVDVPSRAEAAVLRYRRMALAALLCLSITQ